MARLPQRPQESGGEPPKVSLPLSSVATRDLRDTSSPPKSMASFRNTWISLPGEKHPCCSPVCKKLSSQFFVFSHVTSLTSSFSQSQKIERKRQPDVISLYFRVLLLSTSTACCFLCGVDFTLTLVQNKQI